MVVLCSKSSSGGIEVDFPVFVGNTKYCVTLLLAAVPITVASLKIFIQSFTYHYYYNFSVLLLSSFFFFFTYSDNCYFLYYCYTSLI